MRVEEARGVWSLHVGLRRSSAVAGMARGWCRWFSKFAPVLRRIKALRGLDGVGFKRLERSTTCYILTP